MALLEKEDDVVQVARIWEFGSQVDSLDVSGSLVVCAASNLEGDIWDGSLHVLDLNDQESSEAMASLNIQAGCSSAKFLGPAQNKVIAATDDGNVSLYDGSTLKCLSVVEGHDDIVSCLACDGNDVCRFYSAGWDGLLVSYNLREAGQLERQLEIEAHSGHINDITHSEELNLVCTVGSDGFARIWDLRNAKEDGVTHIVNVNQIGSSVCWSPSGETQVVVGMEDGTVSTIDIRTNRVVNSYCLPCRVRRMQAKQLKHNFLICGLENASVSVLEYQASEGYIETKRLEHHSDYVTDVVYLEKENVLLTSSWDKTVYLSSCVL